MDWLCEEVQVSGQIWSAWKWWFSKGKGVSQAVFATMLNVSVSTVQKWESPSANKRPYGHSAKLLQMVEAKGVDALLA